MKLASSRSGGARLLVVASLGASMVAATTPPTTQRPFTVRDAIEVASFIDPGKPAGEGASGAVLAAPDGRSLLVATERGRPDRNVIESTLWHLDRATVAGALGGGAAVTPRPLVTLAASSNLPVLSAAQWAQNGSSLLLLGKDGTPFQRLFRLDLARGALTPLTPADQYVGAYAAVDRTIAYTTLVLDGAPAPEGELVAVAGKRLDDLLYAAPAPDALDFESIGRCPSVLHVLRDGVELPLVPRWNGKPLRLYAGEWSGAPPLALSPDGRWLLTVAPVPAVPRGWERYEPGFALDSLRLRPGDATQVAEANPGRPLQVVRIDLRTGEVTPLLDAPLGVTLGHFTPTRLLWMRDGRHAIVSNSFLPIEGATDAAGRRARAASPGLAMVDLETAATTPIAMLDLPDVRAASSFSIDDVAWDAARQVLTLTYRAAGASTAPPARRLRFDGRRWRATSPPSPAAAVDPLGIHIAERFDRSPVLVGRGADGSERALFDPNPQLATIALGEVRLYTWRDVEGRAWSGLLALPPCFLPGARVPLVIQTHGFRRDRFFTDGQYTTGSAGRALAAKGIAVLQMEMPLTAIWSPADAPLQLRGMEGAVAKLAADGIADPARVGIIGFSFTCYHTLYALTHRPQLFAAASITEGNNMSYSQYLLAEGDRDWQRIAESTLGGVPWGEAGERWLRDAPGFHLDQVRAPLLIVALERGQLLRQWEPYAALRRLGHPVDLLWLRREDAPHVLVQPRHRLLSQQAAVDWFDFWLAGGEDTGPAKADQYARWRVLRAERDAAATPPSPP